DPVALDDLVVERDPDPGLRRDPDVAVLERHPLLRQRLVDRGIGDAVLLEERVRDDSIALERRRLDDPGLPRMWDGLAPVLARERGDPQPLRDAPAAGHVGLDEIDVATLDQPAEAPDRRVLLAGRDADLDGVGELGVGLVLVGLERLLEPEDPDPLQLARDVDRRLRVAAVTEPGLAP